jgi:chromosomal replication initiator protein
MIADIAQPDLETRIAILSAKSKERNYNLSTDVLHAIASTVQSNIRELEGALNRIVAYHQLNNTEPTLEGVKSLLVSVARAPKRGGVTPRQITQTVADFFELRVADLFGASRKKELVVPRQIAMYLMREELQSSFPSIGIELGNRDHTTAMHACSKISAQLENDERLKQNIALILQRLYNA